MMMRLSKEQREEISKGFQSYAEEQWSVEIGTLAAQNALDWMLEQLTPHLYNQALEDARHVAHQAFLSLEDELFALEKKQQLTPRK